MVAIFLSPSHSSQSSLSMLSAAPAKMLAKDVFPTPLAPRSTTRYGLPGSVGSPAESVEMNESEEDQLPRLPSDSPAELVQDLEREMQAGTRVRKLSVSRWLPGSQTLHRWSSLCRRRLCRRTLDIMVPATKLGWTGLTDSGGIKTVLQGDALTCYHTENTAKKKVKRVDFFLKSRFYTSSASHTRVLLTLASNKSAETLWSVSDSAGHECSLSEAHRHRSEPVQTQRRESRIKNEVSFGC